MNIKIDVYYDFSCPWCYVGLLRLHSAIQQYGEKVEVVGHSYMIDTSTCRHGEEVKEYCERRWGSDEWIKDLKESGEKDDALFKNWKYWPNSFHAHRLIQYAHDCHFKNIRLLVLSIFRGIYEEGKNISSIDTLAQIAESNGLSGARKVLSSTDYATSVIEEDDYAKDDLEIQGVPFFIVNNQFYLEGANPSAAFVNVFHVVDRMLRNKDDEVSEDLQ